MASKQFKMFSILEAGKKILTTKVFGIEEHIFNLTQRFRICYYFFISLNLD